MRFIKCVACVIAMLVLCFANVQAREHVPGPMGVARAYFEAMDAGDLDRAERLFAATSSIFETGGVEGTWKQYREHHIGPEIANIDTFATSLGDPESFESKDRTMAVVTWPIEYRIRLKDERLIESRGTVTFVMMMEESGYRIRHMHWSSRRKQK